jgi:DNA-binding response OmpR family regulator
MRISAKLKNLAAREASDLFVQGPFEVRPGTQKICVRNENGTERKMELTSSQFKVLYYLLRNVEKTISRDELLKEVWRDNTHVSGRTVDTHIYTLRKLLGRYSKMIQSVHRQGYRLSLAMDKAKKTA